MYLFDVAMYIYGNVLNSQRRNVHRVVPRERNFGARTNGCGARGGLQRRMTKKHDFDAISTIANPIIMEMPRVSSLKWVVCIGKEVSMRTMSYIEW